MEVRFNDREWQQIADAARERGVTPTGLCADAVMHEIANAPQVDRPDREALARLQAELFLTKVAVNRVGTNLNQIAAKVNAGRIPVWSARAAAAVAVAVERISDVCDRVDLALR